MVTTTLYALLEVPVDASAEEIQKAFRALALTCHPDVRPGDRQAEERFKQISAAYQVLSDPRKRAAYDLKIGRAYVSWERSQPRTTTYEDVYRPERDVVFDMQRDLGMILRMGVFLLLGFIFVFSCAWVFGVLDRQASTSFFLFSVDILLPVAISLVVLLQVVLGIMRLRKWWLRTVASHRCPQCLQRWARQDVRKSVLGIFRRAMGSRRLSPMKRFVKYRVYHQCRFCGHTWSSVQIRPH